MDLFLGVVKLYLLKRVNMFLLNSTPDKQHVSSNDGESVTLSCNYRASSENIYLYWYKQHSNQAPQYLLHKGARSYSMVKDIPDERFKSTTSRNSTQLTIPNLTIADTAIYYCALMDAQ
uniref:Ig-like domain-containing protein n=1 Tax=Paramormyrops kingsleyae TaxID=1676925 RepID=A0A3B3SQZ1_9TELE